jgi:hypothetical protein
MKMEVLSISGYKDGGTISIITNCGNFCLDSRIMTETKYQIYDSYPRDDNSNLIKDQKSIKWNLYQSLKKMPENQIIINNGFNRMLNYTISIFEEMLKKEIRKEKLKKINGTRN